MAVILDFARIITALDGERLSRSIGFHGRENSLPFAVLYLSFNRLAVKGNGHLAFAVTGAGDGNGGTLL